LIVGLLLHRGEPDYQGKPLSHAVIHVLGEAGALAKPAVPAIGATMVAFDPERALPEGAGALIQAAREALLRIDPIAVPEFDVPVP
jgi:hypothetical protein